MQVTDLSVYHQCPTTLSVWHIQISENPVIFDQPKHLLITVPIGAFAFGSTDPNGMPTKEMAEARSDYGGDDKVFYNAFIRELRSVVDMRSIHYDLIATETIHSTKRKWIRIWNERTRRYIKFQMSYPEISDKQIQLLFSRFLRSEQASMGYLKIGFPWDHPTTVKQ